MRDGDALVVDASVWVAAYDVTDAHHEGSVSFLRAVEEAGVAVHIPAFALVESGCAIARRTGSSARASAATRALMHRPSLTIEPMSAALIATAMEIGIERRLRGADAVYAATAWVTGGQLVAWDQELLERGDAVAPTVWVATRL